MNCLRITSGKYKGKSIATPGGATHPMGERERLALFNMISSYLDGAMVLDAYAGSGALGIEALSRGAKMAVFVDNSPKAVATIHRNLKEVGVKEGGIDDVVDGSPVAQIIKGKVADYHNRAMFDIVLVDPPYDNFYLSEVEELVQLMSNGGILVLSHPGEAPTIKGLTLLKTRHYARANITIYH